MAVLMRTVRMTFLQGLGRQSGMSGVLSSELLRVLQVLALESNLLAVSSKEGEGKTRTLVARMHGGVDYCDSSLKRS